MACKSREMGGETRRRRRLRKKSSNDLVQGSSATARDQSHNLATARRPISLSFTSATHTASFVFRKPPTPSCIPSSQHVNDHIEVVGRQAAANDQSRNLSRDGRLNKLLCLISEPAKRGNVARHQPVAAAHPFLRSQRHGTPPLHDGWRRPLQNVKMYQEKHGVYKLLLAIPFFWVPTRSARGAGDLRRNGCPGVLGWFCERMGKI